MKQKKLLLVGIMITCLSLPGWAQKVSLKFTNTRFENVLSSIKKQTGYFLIYSDQVVNVNRLVSISVKNTDLANALSKLLEGTNIGYKIENNKIYFIEKQRSAPQPSPKYNKKTITGQVVDEKGEPVIGAKVVENGSPSNVTVTDLNGVFKLSTSGREIEITYIGFQKQIVDANRSNLKIILKEETKSLNEVVVVGYGTQKKANLTGAVGSVSMADLGDRPLTNSSTALEGTVSGVYALQKSGKPGDDGAVINIRGVGTLNNSDPLVLIDGFPGSMSDVDASDISSISVLKDAASAAIYGNRAANGVVLITTKRGTSGKMSVSYSGYYGVQKSTSLPSTLNSYEYTTLYNEACVNTGMQKKYTDAQIQKYKDGTDIMYPNTNYFDVYYGKANIQNHRLNITGGTDKVQYAIMLGYLDQDGILVGTNYRKTDFRTNIDSYFLNKKLRFSTRLSGNLGTKNEPTDLWSAEWYATNAPIFPLKNAAGQWVSVNGERNFYGEIKEGSTTKNQRYTFNGQVEGEYKILNDLSFQLTYGYNVESADNNAFHANVLLANTDGSTKTLTSDLTETNSLNIQTLLTSLLKYNKKIGKHDLSAMAGYSEEYFNWKWNSGYRSGFINNTQRILNLGDASTMKNDAGNYDLGLRSYFGRINYSFDGRYLFEANIRRDGSSRFAKGLQWGNFPSFSAGWIISEENFMKNFNWLDMFKIRASWGKLGNQNINSYYVGNDILSTGQNYSLNGTLQPGVAVNSMTNKATTWETTEQTNIGFDMVLKNGISVTADYFIKKTKGILMQTPIPLTMGDLSAPYVNAGKVENKGIEASISYRKTFSNGLKIRSTLNLSHIVNKVTDLNGASPIINGAKALKEGYAINSFYGYKMDGVYQISDFTWQNNSDQSIAYTDRKYTLKPGVVSVANFTATPGDVKYKDLDGDGVVTMDKDRTILGKQFPDLSYSLQFNAEWKHFDLGLFLQGVQGIQGYTYYEIATAFSGFANLGSWWNGRWTPENPSNKYPKLSLDGVRNNIQSSFYMENAAYLRLKNIELGYTFDNNLFPVLGTCKVRVYGNVQNAFTITKFKGFDPEQVVDQTRAEAFPQVRIFSLGVNVNF